MDANWQALAKNLSAIVLLAVFAQSGMAATPDSPDVVELNSLQNLYLAVTFDHAMHSGVAACAACHHHTTGTPPVDAPCLKCHKDSGPAMTAACTGCHPAEPGNPSAKIRISAPAAAQFHWEMTGLKRAYHVKCLGCHQEMGAATGCQDCHPKKDN